MSVVALPPAGSDQSAPETPASGPRRPSVLRSLGGSPSAIAAAVYLVVLAVLAVTAPLIAPHDPHAQDLAARFAGVSGEHLLGTDEFGRDVASRIVYAARISLIAPLISLVVGMALGVPAGLLAGLRGGVFDMVSARISDTLLSVPAIVFALAVIAVMGPSLTNAMIAIGIVFAPHLFRVVRGATMAVAGETYISSAQAIGASTPRILLVHVLPNIRAPLLVQATLLMGFALLAEASLSFLGLGVQPPDASWGSMLKAAYENQAEAPYSVLPSGVAILITVLSFNVLGDRLRDAVAARRSQ
ncbi:ABC transporter permease [Nonomuraea lactucae]|uniref:ABC transporter permease n=1 Tax=Nonomuraea lactucae TaxID=2249762 RepID=UPI000DE3D917|nr:ABC transporter permease [Nonomuraea lactucae]